MWWDMKHSSTTTTPSNHGSTKKRESTNFFFWSAGAASLIDKSVEFVCLVWGWKAIQHYRDLEITHPEAITP